MITNAIQLDYGGFDSRFLGVTIRFDAHYPMTWDEFNQINLRPRTPSQVVAIGNASLKKSPAKAFETFSVGTVLLHELRHFHDFVLSPLGNQLFRLRLNAAIHGLQAIGLIQKQNKIIPVPVSRWQRKGISEQQKLISQWDALLGMDTGIATLDLRGDLKTLFEETEKAYQLVKRLVGGLASSSGTMAFQPYHIFEASALINQIQNVWTVFGAEHANLFINVLLNDPSAGSYTKAFRLLAELWKREGELIDTPLMSAIITWSLLGDHIADGDAGLPTERFARLFEHLYVEGLPSSSKLHAELFEEWSSKLNASPIEANLRHTAIWNERYFAKLEKLPVAHQDVFTDLIGNMKMLLEVNSYMTTRFLANPTFYTSPYPYQENIEEWIAAPIAIEFVNGGLAGNQAELQKQLSLHKYKLLDSGSIVLSQALLSGQTAGIEKINSVQAMSALDTMILCDLFFAEFRRDEPDMDVARQVMEQNGFTLLEILI